MHYHPHDFDEQCRNKMDDGTRCTRPDLHEGRCCNGACRAAVGGRTVAQAQAGFARFARLGVTMPRGPVQPVERGGWWSRLRRWLAR